MRISRPLYQILTQESDRLLDRLIEAVELDFFDARDNASLHPAPDVIAAVKAAHEEYLRFTAMLRQAGGARHLGWRGSLPPDPTLPVVLKAAMPLVRKVTNLLRKAHPEPSADAASLPETTLSHRQLQTSSLSE